METILAIGAFIILMILVGKIDDRLGNSEEDLAKHKLTMFRKLFIDK